MDPKRCGIRQSMTLNKINWYNAKSASKCLEECFNSFCSMSVEFHTFFLPLPRSMSSPPFPPLLNPLSLLLPPSFPLLLSFGQ